MKMSDIYGMAFCMDHIEAFSLNRFEDINIKVEQRRVHEFNKKNNSNVKGFVKLDREYKYNSYLLNEPDVKDIHFKLDEYVTIQDDKAICLFRNEEKNLRYAYELGTSNKVFLIQDKGRLVIDGHRYNLIEGQRYEFKVRDYTTLLLGTYESGELVMRRGDGTVMARYELYRVVGVREIYVNPHPIKENPNYGIL